MRRLLFAAGMALFLHGLLLTVKADHFKKMAEPLREPEPIRLALTYKTPEKRRAPVLRIPARPRPKPLPEKKRPEKKEVDTGPPKVERIRPMVKKPPKIERSIVKKPMSKEPVTPGTGEPEPSPAPPPEESPGPVSAEPVIKNVPEAPVVTLPPPPLKEASPLYRENPVPEYPRTARRRGYEGTVMLEVLVNTRGKVDDLRLHQSSGYGVLDRAAMRSVKDWIFEPGKRADQAVEMWVKVPVRFDLKDP